MRIQLTEPASTSTYDHLLERLVAFNRTHRDDFKLATFSIEVLGDMNEIIGGLYASISGGMMVVELLWISEVHRGNGIGTEIMNKAHNRGRELSAKRAMTDTFDFQAPEFYQILGYKIFGSVPYPNNTVRHYLVKDL